MKKEFEPTEHPHRRFNPLINEWVLVSPHRAKRPWQGQTEDKYELPNENYNVDCYLCPGNRRVNGETNEKYTGPYVFRNDFSALRSDTPEYSNAHPLFRVQSEQGESRVVCYSPDHSKTMPQLRTGDVISIIETWIQQCTELGAKYQSVQIFENKGSQMGCSNPHPHGQIWAQDSLPSIVNKKQNAQLDYSINHNSSLLRDYVDLEITKNERIVVINEHWVVLVPFWAVWPFETILLPRFDIQRMDSLSVLTIKSLANILQEITIRYDNLFKCSFPYSMGWHGAPYDGSNHPEWTLHASFFPPLLRSSSIRKFMVGYEMLAESQRDITAEQAATLLKEQSSIHYSKVDDYA